ncbi:hypothetical protein JG687_00004117 [Phytophthora cactorum]|uniref:Uncharacterized protein n=1 Tax=Phytophthora cactorum TaxID=29920 RepID=A0A8T1UU15_9STRA|nr:hypothetical protein PC120_g1827 [Phytophthora cactorum]KAG3094104.1 hypothetical protein PC121_g3126 [Phytophthora cactorum]KAG3200215.1 hypothetical protein PC128_g4764 [Phytophthora cactorum]KAG4062967.1 hypothetical protein PC123_g2217 [Phytophthora cactorum]KAG6967738.1 hypothetical protein JG687_00004117 [Phytophthora cactorum]
MFRTRESRGYSTSSRGFFEARSRRVLYQATSNVPQRGPRDMKVAPRDFNVHLARSEGFSPCQRHCHGGRRSHRRHLLVRPERASCCIPDRQQQADSSVFCIVLRRHLSIRQATRRNQLVVEAASVSRTVLCACLAIWQRLPFPGGLQQDGSEKLSARCCIRLQDLAFSLLRVFEAHHAPQQCKPNGVACS